MYVGRINIRGFTYSQGLFIPSYPSHTAKWLPSSPSASQHHLRLSTRSRSTWHPNPLVSTINALPTIHCSSVLFVCPYHCNTPWSTLLACSLSIPASISLYSCHSHQTSQTYYLNHIHLSCLSTFRSWGLCPNSSFWYRPNPLLLCAHFIVPHTNPLHAFTLCDKALSHYSLLYLSPQLYWKWLIFSNGSTPISTFIRPTFTYLNVFECDPQCVNVTHIHLAGLLRTYNHSHLPVLALSSLICAVAFTSDHTIHINIKQQLRYQASLPQSTTNRKQLTHIHSYWHTPYYLQFYKKTLNYFQQFVSNSAYTLGICHIHDDEPYHMPFANPVPLKYSINIRYIFFTQLPHRNTWSPHHLILPTPLCSSLIVYSVPCLAFFNGHATYDSVPLYDEWPHRH